MACESLISGVMAMVTLAAAGGPDHAVIGTEATFPPYIFYGDDGALTGFDHDVGTEVCRRARLDCDWQVAEFDQLIPGVQSGRFDIAISGFGITPERARIVDFTMPYTQATGSDWFIGHPGAPDVAAAQIGVQAGTLHETHLHATGRSFRAYHTEAALLAALMAGDIDLAFGPFGGDSRLSDLAAADIVQLYEENAPSDGVAMVVCKGNDGLREKLDAAIAAMQNDGTLETFSDTWF